MQPVGQSNYLITRRTFPYRLFSSPIAPGVDPQFESVEEEPEKHKGRNEHESDYENVQDCLARCTPVDDSWVDEMFLVVECPEDEVEEVVD